MQAKKLATGFRIIKGMFHPELGQMDGDSVRFMADESGLFDGLKGRRIKFKADGTVQLRYEGIDALEKAAIQPFAKDATATNRDFLLQGTGATSAAGYILTRQGDVNGRPVSFVFRGNPPGPDGEDIILKAPLVRKSGNFHMMKAGYAYPMFYETLFQEIRQTLLEALSTAKAAKRGYWPKDATMKGVAVNSKSDKATIPPIFPKLWRRLFQDYKGSLADLNAFKQWLNEQDERLFTLSDRRFISFADVVEVKNGKVRMTYRPEDLVFRPA